MQELFQHAYLVGLMLAVIVAGVDCLGFALWCCLAPAEGRAYERYTRESGDAEPVEGVRA